MNSNFDSSLDLLKKLEKLPQGPPFDKAKAAKGFECHPENTNKFQASVPVRGTSNNSPFKRQTCKRRPAAAIAREGADVARAAAEERSSGQMARNRKESFNGVSNLLLNPI